MNTSTLLFSPISIGSLELPARLFKTATAETMGTSDGFVTPQLIEFYRLLAQGDTPLIITGNIYISLQGKSAPFQLGADNDDKISGLREITKAVHRYGSRIITQLNHCGRQIVPDFVGASDVVSASTVKELMTGTQPRALTEEEVKRVVQHFGDAAARCRQAGFDGVQIHGANGYLISQFLTPYTNRRTDAYGGTYEKRLQFPREVLRAIRARVGKNYPVILKMNGADKLPLRDGLDTADLSRIAKAMEEEGVDAIEISVGHYESGFPMVRGTFGRCLGNMVKGSMAYLPGFRRVFMRIAHPVVAFFANLMWRGREGFNLEYAGEIKQSLSIPLICVGGFRTREAMERALTSKNCDAVSAGRAFIADPFFFRHLRTGETGPECVDCNACVGHLGARANDCYHPVVAKQKAAMLESFASLDSDPVMHSR